MLPQAYNVIIYQGFSAPDHGREVAYGLNVTEKRFILQFMATVQLKSSKGYAIHMVRHYATNNVDFILEQELKKLLYNELCKNVVIDKGKYNG